MHKVFNYLKNSDLKYIFLLALLCLVGFWQVSFMIHPLKWDIIDYYFPSRLMLGEMLHQGSLPLWVPYQTLGFPLHAEPQTGAWYPITLLLGFVKGYSINMMSVEFMLHVFLSGWGMFTLGKTLKYHSNTSFLIAIAYMFSGFITGNAQHLTFIINAAWIPFVLSAFISLFNEKSIFNALKLSFFGYMLLSAGYPAYLFILAYLFLFIFLYFLWIEFQQNRIQGVFNYLKYLSLSGVVLAIVSTIVITSMYFVMPFLSRAHGITPIEALVCPFSPQCAVSFLTPLAVNIKNGWEVFNTDMSMANGYFGIILLVFAIVGLWIKKAPLQWLFLIISILCLLISFGESTPLRMFLYDYIPLMNLFRFPSVFRFFFILFILIVAGNVIQKTFIENKVKPIQIYITAAILAISMLVTILVFRFQGYLDIKNTVMHDLFTFSKKGTFSQQFVIQAAIQIGVLSLFLFIIFRYKLSLTSLKLVTLLVIGEMLLSTQLVAPYTVYDGEITNNQCKKFIQTLPTGFPIPNNDAVIKNESLVKKEIPFWRNTCVLNKRISQEGFTSFKFNDFRFLEDLMPEFFSSMLNNSPVYLTNSIFPFEKLKSHYLQKQFDSTFIYLDSADYTGVKEIATFDSLVGSAKIVKFSPTKVTVEVDAQRSAVVVYLQNRFTGWHTTINGKESKMLKVNRALMGVVVPAGKSTVIFEYRPKAIIIAYFISLISFFVLTLVLLFLWIRKESKRYCLPK